MMIRKLMASSALAALMAAGTIGYATAQTSPATEQPATQATSPAMPADAAGTDSAAMPADVATDSAAAGVTGETHPTLTPDEPTLASAFMGRAVYSSEDPEADNIGEVNDLIVSNDGSITHAVVGVGGFLGIGEKNVSVPFDELEVVEREGDIRLIYAATREQLESAEEFDRTAYDPAARAEPATGDLASAPMSGGAPMAGSDPMAGGAATDPAKTDLAAAPAEPAPDAATDTAATAPATETTMAEATAPADAATGADATASTDMAANYPASEAGFVNIGEGQIRATTMLGKEVYGQDEESIGEVADLVLQDDGQTRAAIIDVGGFLGVGEKRVAIPFNEIQTAQEGDEVRLNVAMTREQLEQAPDYIEPDMTADSTDTATAPAADVAAGTDASGAPATDASGAPVTDIAAAPADGQPTDPNAPAQVQSVGSAGMEYELASQELTADNLIGTAVYSPNEENLGDVGDVVFDQAGSIQAVVIDVGGFLGIGEKPVAVQYDALNVQKDANGDLRIVVNATQEQLEGAPAFDEAPAQ